MTVAGFDMSGEILREIKLPASFDKYRYFGEFTDHQMAVIGGSFSLLLWPSHDYGVEVWMMKKYGVRDSWTKFTISNPWSGIFYVSYLSAEDKFVLAIRGKIFYFYKEIADESVGNKLDHSCFWHSN
ncbi:uncharacterized protein LOC131325898 [Rhododendron vialii]|uniref:uncharacterized protein LOC131325898 n=1 Tax=Rhododendron vialii TaxID=182163 RepID=UPI00265FF87F|nr:uncharacterized protein LOC131325898 [Rhododendron vialii]